jgi:hypothetical protein
MLICPTPRREDHSRLRPSSSSSSRCDVGCGINKRRRRPDCSLFKLGSPRRLSRHNQSVRRIGTKSKVALQLRGPPLHQCFRLAPRSGLIQLRQDLNYREQRAVRANVACWPLTSCRVRQQSEPSGLDLAQSQDHHPPARPRPRTAAGRGRTKRAGAHSNVRSIPGIMGLDTDPPHRPPQTTTQA